jgi:peroxiredoxin
VSGDDRDEDREREIEELLKGRGGPPAGGRRDRGGELEDLLGDPSAGRAGSGRPGKGAPATGASSGPEGGSRDTDRSGRRDQAGGATGGPREADTYGDPGDQVKLPLNYGALVGILIALLAVFILVSTLRNTESGTVGIGPVGIGERVDPFAVPVATSDLEGDANVDPDEACRVAGKDVVRICDYFDRPLLISFWFTGGASECVDQQDVFDQVAERFMARVGAVSINVRDSRDKVRRLVEERGWKVPVGHDTDGAVSNMYRVGGCPTFLFVRAGGVLEQAEIGRTTVAELSSQVRSFLNGQEAKEKAAQEASGS